MVDLSVIIVSFNTKDITHDCITALFKSLRTSFQDRQSEVIVIDNVSTDGSREMISQLLVEFNDLHIGIKTIFNDENTGFSRANNKAVREASGKYILYLNSDVIINDVDFSAVVDYLNQHSEIGALTVKVNLSSDKIDPASHRGFPTIWNSFCYFSGLEKLTNSIPVLGSFFGGYHLTSQNLNTVHEIDSPSGAFYISPKEIIDEVNGYDEQFFMYGEDLDLSYRIKKLGKKIVYYPLFSVTHLKGKSGLKTTDPEIQNKIRGHFYNAMKLFYKKHYSQHHSEFVNNLIYFFIDLKHKKS